MTLRDLSLLILDSINILVLNPDGKLVAIYDGKESIQDEFLDRRVSQIIRVTFNTIWVEIV